MGLPTENQLRQELAGAWDLLDAERRANAALRKDAERYRWMCATLGETELPTLIERITKGYVADYKPSIDAAIDAAMTSDQAVGAA